MSSTESQEKIIPVNFGGRRYQVTVDVHERGFVVKRTVLDGHDSPLTGVLASLCRDQIQSALEQGIGEAA